MMDETTLELGLRARPPADPVYRSLITTSPPTTHRVTTQPRRRVAGEPRPMLTAVRLVAAVAILALGAGAWYLAADSGPVSVPAASPSPAASTSPSFLPSVIPAGVPNGVIDTPIGSARWAYLHGDPTSLPGPLSPIPGPSGSLLWFDEGDWGPVSCEVSGAIECLARPQLWTSADAISERVELPLPVDAASARLAVHDGTYWLVTSGPTSMWRSTDAERWERIDLSALVAPGPDELDWEVGLGVPVASGESVVVPITYQALDATRLLGRPDLRSAWPAWPQQVAPGLYRIVQEVQDESGGASLVRIEKTTGGLRFSDEAGTEIATLDGVSLDFVDAWASAGAVRDYQVAVVDDGVVTPVSLPGPSVSDRWDYGPTVLGTSAGFHAFKVTADRTIRVWRSDDGRVWTETEPLGDDEGEPRDVGFVYLHPGWGGPAVVRAGGQGQDEDTLREWETVDGITWTTVPYADSGGGNPFRFGDRWLSWSEDMGPWQASIDGLIWEPATELSAVISPATGGTVGWSYGLAAVIGETLFYAGGTDYGTRERDLWVIEFVAEPDGAPTEVETTTGASQDGVSEGG